ncbi:hypothetical protein JCM10512_2780 [Bacteroides reticulotermitis JCM 10512]|uniref:Uncharacterized protein n=1 Tax=Bacteroides reticulotermitis JCM 10512 TaxID=1445607 RepID=W4UU59_9BACE|nr:hypothetical protein JCM10512_2780 [Bacteroides reticulotermitis JCM 10512]
MFPTSARRHSYEQYHQPDIDAANPTYSPQAQAWFGLHRKRNILSNYHFLL